MKYNEFIHVNEEFQSSVNLEYDLYKTDKIKGYIPTEQSVKILGAFLRSYYYNTDPQGRASVLIGPYGRGKSHLLLVLSALTSLDCQGTKAEQRNAKRILVELCEKISRVNNEIGALAKAVVDTNIRTLPVIINSNTSDINQAFLVALNDALTRANLENLLPDTYFDSALTVISKWEADFPEALARFKSELRRKKTSLEEIKIGLHQFQQHAYRIFCDCYPLIAAGADFNPLTNMDVVKLYIAVTNALKEQTRYCGISVIFDEFSKFLEANLDKSRMLNFKIIQDLAEAATRSGDAQLHFTCITHKDILDYSSSDSFKTVEGRFRKLRFVASSEQSYELIANAIIKKDYFVEYKKANEKAFSLTADRSAMTNLFADLSPETYENKIVSGCFPLAPLSVFALLHVSELVGQNERTLFTFLAQPDDYTLRRFIEEDIQGVKWITVDYIYDYFEELFKQEVFNATVHSIWAKTDSALKQAAGALEQKTIKAIAIINMVGDERWKPVPAHIKAAILLSDEEFDSAINTLLKKHVLAQRDSSEFVLLTANGVDVQRSVDNYVKTSLPKINICDTLSRACDLGFVMPREYNDKFSMLRCFRNIYMEDTTFLLYKNAKQLLSDYPFDGVIIYIVSPNGNANDKVLKKLQSFANSPQIVVCLTTHEFSYEGLLKQHEAALRLLESDKDPHFVEELEVFSEDLEKRIQTAVYTMYSPASEFSTFYTYKGKVDITRQVELNHLISDVCSECYDLTPVVNNEMVNKTSLNAQNTKARDLVVAWILQHSEDASIPCMEGYGPEVSIFKSAFKHTGLDISSKVQDKGMNSVLEIISSFIRGSEKNKSNFQSLYQVLSSAPYGMRKGVIPLYLAYVLRQYKESIVLYFKGKEIELQAAVLSHLNDNPESYEVLIEAGTAEKTAYLDNLQALFEKYGDSRVPSINRIYSIVKSMQNWVRSLPEYSKRFNRYLKNGEYISIPQEAVALRRDLMKFEINSREMLLSDWPRILTEDESITKCFGVIKEIKVLLDNHLSLYRNELAKKITALFVPGYQGGLTRSMISWFEQLPDTTRTHIFDNTTNSLLTIANSINSYNDDTLLDLLAMSFTSIAIEDWNDEMADAFIKNITDAINRINEYVGSEANDSQDGRLVIDIHGLKIEKTFASDTISPLGTTALNNLRAVFDEYNESLEPDEQLAIIAKLIGEIIR